MDRRRFSCSDPVHIVALSSFLYKVFFITYKETTLFDADEKSRGKQRPSPLWRNIYG